MLHVRQSHSGRVLCLHRTSQRRQRVTTKPFGEDLVMNRRNSALNALSVSSRPIEREMRPLRREMAGSASGYPGGPTVDSASCDIVMAGLKQDF